jgi:hypothetical protein
MPLFNGGEAINCIDADHSDCFAAGRGHSGKSRATRTFDGIYYVPIVRV